MSCGTEIAWYDNVPLLSYALLRGRCRNCGASIALRYPAVELATGAALRRLLLALRADAWTRPWRRLLLRRARRRVSATDLEHRIIPNRIVVPAAAIVLVAQTALHPSARVG